MPETKAINKVIYGGRVLIDLTGDTITADKLLAGYKAHGADGNIVNGTCDYDMNTQVLPLLRFCQVRKPALVVKWLQVP